MSKEATVQEILDAVRRDVDGGLDVVERTKAEQNVADHVGDGPRMQAWLNRPATSAPPPPPISGDLVERIERIVRWERGDWRAAGVGLAMLRLRYESIDPADLADDEQSWDAFAAKHIPLPAARVADLIGKAVMRGGLLRCTSCGNRVACECGCGVPYAVDHRWALPVGAMPEPAPELTALDRAAAALVIDPGRSNRAIAAEIGVSAQTVKRAREKMQETADGGAADVAPDRRIGRDGRSYPVARKPPE